MNIAPPSQTGFIPGNGSERKFKKVEIDSSLANEEPRGRPSKLMSSKTATAATGGKQAAKKSGKNQSDSGGKAISSEDFLTAS